VRRRRARPCTPARASLLLPPRWRRAPSWAAPSWAAAGGAAAQRREACGAPPRLGMHPVRTHTRFQTWAVCALGWAMHVCARAARRRAPPARTTRTLRTHARDGANSGCVRDTRRRSAHVAAPKLWGGGPLSPPAACGGAAAGGTPAAPTDARFADVKNCDNTATLLRHHCDEGR
jgi:hypothetical protein